MLFFLLRKKTVHANMPLSQNELKCLANPLLFPLIFFLIITWPSSAAAAKLGTLSLLYEQHTVRSSAESFRTRSNPSSFSISSREKKAIFVLVVVCGIRQRKMLGDFRDHSSGLREEVEISPTSPSPPTSFPYLLPPPSFCMLRGTL